MTKNKQKQSFWGNWWVPIRLWFYPVWLAYETIVRFYEYTLGVHQYFEKQQQSIASYIGNMGAQVLDILCSGLTFAVCTAFLTVPVCFITYRFLKAENPSATRLEAKIKFLL